MRIIFAALTTSYLIATASCAALVMSGCAETPVYSRVAKPGTLEARQHRRFACRLTRQECAYADAAADRINEVASFKILEHVDNPAFADLTIVAASERYNYVSYKHWGLTTDRIAQVGAWENEQLNPAKPFADYVRDGHRSAIQVYVAEGVLSDRAMVGMFEHEFLHALGFGHANGAFSVTNEHSISDGTYGLTEYDIRSLRAEFGLDGAR